MSEDILALFIPIIAIFMSLLIPIVYALVDYRRRRDLVEANHKERMAAIERGIEPPNLPESFYLAAKPPRRSGRMAAIERGIEPPNLPESFYLAAKPPRRSGYLLTGLIWLFVGIGLFMALGAVAGEDVRLFGLIPIGVGAAFLIYYVVEGRKLTAGEPGSPPAA